MLDEIVKKLREVTDFCNEYDSSEFPVFQTLYERFLISYPYLRHFADYLGFLRMTGGAFIDHHNYSLVIYGFGGNVAPSFEEPRLFLDRDRYFHFGDVVMPTHAGTIKVFAFDLMSETDIVHVSDDGVWEYDHFSGSFCDMLKIFVDLAR